MRRIAPDFMPFLALGALFASCGLSDSSVEYIGVIAEQRGAPGSREIVLEGDDRIVTPTSFRPPVEITIRAKTDLTNLRIAYAADQVIFNWELDPTELRVNGGPADGKHMPGAGRIPANEYVTIKWLVTSQGQSISVDGRLRYEHTGDYSQVDEPIAVFPAVHSRVTVKSIKVRQLSVAP